jgi:SAM-dependent methyltransferase
MGDWLLDDRWNDVPRLDLEALMGRCTRVVVIASSTWDGHVAVGATLADIAHDDVPVSMTNSLRPFDDRTLVIAPPDSRAAAGAHDGGSILLEYAPFQAESSIDWRRMRLLAPTLAGLREKQAVLCRLDRSRAATSHRCVAEFVQIPAQPDLAARIENFVIPPRPHTDIASPFDAMIEDGHDDPWQLDTSPYERRRLELLLACLGRPHYERVLEIGCATGQLSVALGKRATEVIAMDASPRALAVARDRAGSDGIRWVLGAAPQNLPDVDADLVVLSEIGYFLDGPDLLATLRHARNHLRPHGEIVLANWRRPTENIPLDGNTVQAQAASMLDLPRRAHYEDADLIIDVWGEPVSVYDEYAGA